MKSDPQAAPGDRSTAVISVAFAVLLLILVGAFQQQRSTSLAGGRPDLRVYLAAARIVSGPERRRLYDWSEQRRQQSDWPGEPSPYLNPPFVAIAFVPLLRLSRETAYLITFLLEVAAVVLAMLLSARLAGVKPWPVLALAALAHPVSLLLWISVQPAPFIALAWAGFGLAWTRGKTMQAVCWLALGLAIKPHLMLPLLLLLPLSRDWRAAAMAAAAGTAMGAVTWAAVGLEGLKSYSALLRMEGGAGHFSVNPAAMVNLRGLLSSAFGESGLTRAVAIVLSIALLGSLCWIARRKGGGEEPRRRAALLVLALAATLLTSFHMHVQELGGLFVLAAAAGAAGWLRPRQVISASIYINAALWVLSLAAVVYGGVWAVVPLSLIAVYLLGFRACLRSIA